MAGGSCQEAAGPGSRRTGGGRGDAARQRAPPQSASGAAASVPAARGLPPLRRSSWQCLSSQRLCAGTLRRSTCICTSCSQCCCSISLICCNLSQLSQLLARQLAAPVSPVSMCLGTLMRSGLSACHAACRPCSWTGVELGRRGRLQCRLLTIMMCSGGRLLPGAAARAVHLRGSASAP